jgi:hypothetical protein
MNYNIFYMAFDLFSETLKLAIRPHWGDRRAGGYGYRPICPETRKTEFRTSQSGETAFIFFNFRSTF